MDAKDAASVLEDDLMHIFDMAERINIMLEEVLCGHYYNGVPISEMLLSALKAASVKVEVAKEATEEVLQTLDNLLS